MHIDQIQNRIFTIRNIQVMVGRDLAELYDVETKVLNQAVKRNLNRFPELFRFQLTDTEKKELVTNCDRFKKLKHSYVIPYVFTEQGVAMLSSVLRSETADIIEEFNDSHDRFIIIDEKDLYHFGASLKDMGKKWFAFSKMDMDAVSVITKLKKKLDRES